MKDFKKKAWIGLGGLTLLSGLWLTVLVLIGEDVYKAAMTAMTVLASSLFFIAALYARHNWLKWASWASTLVLVIFQIVAIFSGYSYESRSVFIQFVDNSLGAIWLITISLVGLVVFSMAYRFVKNLKFAKVGYWIAVALALIGTTLNSITIYTEMASDSYNSDPPLIRYGSASYIMAIFIAILIVVYAIAERRKEVAIEQASINQVSQLMQQGTPLNANSIIGGTMGGGKSIVHVNDETNENPFINSQMEEAFLHFVKLYEEGKISVNYESRARSAAEEAPVAVVTPVEADNTAEETDTPILEERAPELIAEPLSMVSETLIESENEVIVEAVNEEIVAASAAVSSHSDLKYSEPEDLDDVDVDFSLDDLRSSDDAIVDQIDEDLDEENSSVSDHR